MSHLVKALWDELWFVNMGYTNKIWLIDWLSPQIPEAAPPLLHIVVWWKHYFWSWKVTFCTPDPELFVTWNLYDLLTVRWLNFCLLHLQRKRMQISFLSQTLQNQSELAQFSCIRSCSPSTLWDPRDSRCVDPFCRKPLLKYTKTNLVFSDFVFSGFHPSSSPV